MKIVWNKTEDEENFLKFKVSFKEAQEVILNKASLKIKNLYGDFLYLGPTSTLGKILVVNCLKEENYRKIIFARLANKNEENAFFNHLMEGELE